MNKHQFSKVIVIITTLIFLISIISCFIFMVLVTFLTDSEVVDYVVATTIITVVSGLYGMVLKGYMSKSALENTAQIRKSVYKEIMETRIKYDEQVLKLRKKYDVDQETIDEIEADAPFEDLASQAIGQTTNKLDEVDSLNEQEPEVQTF